MWRHYVYVHRRASDGRVFYVGKGTAGRAFDRDGRSPHWRNVANKHGVTVEVCAWFCEESDAHSCEKEFIAWFGRGNLVNLTDGGEGAVGRIMSDATKAKWRETMARRPPTPHPRGMLGKKHTAESRARIAAAAVNPMAGRAHSDESRAKMSAAVRANHPRSRAVRDVATGESFPSARECARQRGLNPNTLKAKLAGRVANTTTLRYV